MPAIERMRPVRFSHSGCILRLTAEAVEFGEARPCYRRDTCRSALCLSKEANADCPGNKNKEN
jgi:hypothetical protein